MGSHVQSTNTSVKRETTPPASPPVAVGQVHVEDGAISRCIRIGAGTASPSDYKPVGFLPMLSNGDPSGTIVSRFALDLVVDITNNQLYYAATAGSNSWTAFSADASEGSVQGAVNREFVEDLLQNSFPPFTYNDGTNSYTFTPGTEGNVWATIEGEAQWADPSVLGGGGGGGGVTREEAEDALANSFSFASLNDPANQFNFIAPANTTKNYFWGTLVGSSTPGWVDLGQHNYFDNFVQFKTGVRLDDQVNSGSFFKLYLYDGRLLTEDENSDLSEILVPNKAQTLTATHHHKIVSLPQTGTVNINTALSDRFYLFLYENVDLDIIEPPNYEETGGRSFQLWVEQGSSNTLTFSSDFCFPTSSPPAAPSASGAMMRIDCTFLDGPGLWFCSCIQNETGGGWVNSGGS